ncbi:MAG: hypothetical protein JSR86_13805 [Proteobacteria bacterium]|nr:hypothetical protein [Pseudomonadota bacterium]
MRRFELHIHDDLTDEPQVYFVEVRDAARAREIALAFLDRDPKRRLVRILGEGQLIETLERRNAAVGARATSGFDRP